MKITCIHGYFIFEESEPGEIGRFSSVYGVELAASGLGYYTFPFLLDAPKYSLIGKTYLNLMAVAMFEGEPWDILEANEFVYDLGSGDLSTLLLIVSPITLRASDFYYVSNSLIQPGSRLPSGQRIMDYTCWFDWSISSFKYTDIGPL
jgi:hypothetical protein